MTIARSLITPLIYDVTLGLLDVPGLGGGTPTPVPTLSLSFASSSVAEDAGTVVGTVTRSGDTTGALTVTLASDDTSEATVPASVDIADGDSDADFTITILNENTADGDQVATISASATDFTGASANVTVTDVGVATSLNPNSDFSNGTTGWLIDNSMGGFSGVGSISETGGELTSACTGGVAVWLITEAAIVVTPGQSYDVTYTVTDQAGGFNGIGWWDTADTSGFLPTLPDFISGGPFPVTSTFRITPGSSQIRIGAQMNNGASLTFSEFKIEAA